MQSKFYWISVETVIAINELVVADSGEPHALLDKMKLEGALQRPYNMWSYDGEEDVLCLSVGYMVSIAQSHPFFQGNKRTGFVAGRNFLQNHGYDLAVPDREEIAALFIEVVDGKKSWLDFLARLERFVVETE